MQTPYANTVQGQVHTVYYKVMHRKNQRYQRCSENWRNVKKVDLTLKVLHLVRQGLRFSDARQIADNRGERTRYFGKCLVRPILLRPCSTTWWPCAVSSRASMRPRPSAEPVMNILAMAYSLRRLPS